MEYIEKEIKELRNSKGLVDEFFVSSPYDGQLNFDGKLTENIFRSQLLVEDEYFMHAKELDNAINSYQRGKRVIILSGFSGGGKTTFIHHFIHENPNYKHIVIDFEDISNRFREIKKHNNPLLSLLKKYLTADQFLNSSEGVFKLTQQTFLFLMNNRIYFLRQGLISNEFNRMLKSCIAEKLSEDYVITTISKLSNEDIFIFFFTSIFNHYNDAKKVLIYFDNLDKVNFEYLSDEFIEDFEMSLARASDLTQSSLFRKKDILFNLRHRFIFCLRDANGILINQHITDRFKNKIKIIPISFTLSPSHFKKIVQKRIAFIPKVYTEEELSSRNEYSGKVFIENLSILLNDPYYKNAFVRLFNNDFRSSINVLMEAVREVSSTDNYFYKNQRLEYGARGYLLHFLIKNLFKHNFISDYPLIDGNIEGISTGYCFIDRMILTVLCFNSRYAIKNSKIDENKSCRLYSDFIKDIEVIYNYDYGLMLSSICRLFTYHEKEKNWVHLVSIMKKKITDVSDFDDEYSALEELKILKQRPRNLKNKAKINKIITALDKIRIKVNPSGFAYVKYILPHFEFYSILCHNNDALYQNFYVKEKRNTYEDYRHRYENTIESVYHLVKNHHGHMKLFYESHMSKVIGKKKFYNSKFCFQLLGEASHNIKGYFHITRILTSHIDYLDRFRHKMFKLNDDNVLFDKVRFNKKMVGYINNYVQLMAESQDDRAIEKLLPDFQGKIKQIEDSGFENTWIQIRLPKQHHLKQ